MDWLTLMTSTGAQITVAGGFGGIARWLIVIILDRKMAVPQGLATIVLGAIMGFFVSPYISTQWLLNLINVQAEAEKIPVLNAFILGLIVVGGAAFIIDWNPWKKKPGTVETVTPPAPKAADGEAT
jgi:hypothetical protein